MNYTCTKIYALIVRRTNIIQLETVNRDGINVLLYQIVSGGLSYLVSRNFRSKKKVALL